MCILSPVCLIFLAGISEYSKYEIMSEDMASGIGVVILLIIVAIATAIFVSNGMKLSKYDFFDEEVISLQYGVKGIVEKKKAND